MERLRETALPKIPMAKFLMDREKEPARLLAGPSRDPFWEKAAEDGGTDWQSALQSVY